MDNKTDLRIKAKSIRKNLNIGNISNDIVTNIRKFNEYIFAKNVMIYHPLKNEINLLELLEDDDKNFYLPRVSGRELECCPYKKGDDLLLSPLNISEPISEAVDKSELDLVFVPALMADKDFHRIGYGAGFYDRFLNGINAYKIIVIPEELLVEKLCSEATDVKCDAYITQKKASIERG